MSKPLNILIVEDHLDSARVMSILLRQDGHTVGVAGGVAQAAEMAAAGSFDLMLCDLGLPDGSGLDLMRDLKRRYAMDGLALSGSSTEADKNDCVAAGFMAHLSKPVCVDLLQDVIRRFAERKIEEQAAEV